MIAERYSGVPDCIAMDDEISGYSSSTRSRSPLAEESTSSPEITDKGTSRGRSRGRGRGRSRGRARGGQSRGRSRGRGLSSPTRHDLIRQRRDERLTQLKSQVEQMSAEGLRELVMQVCERDPSLILDVVHQTSQEERGRGGYHPLPDSDSPDWCVCGRCREMPTEEERECCKQTPVNCISSQPDFDFIVLDPLVLLVARRYRQDILAAGEGQDLNKSNRHAAYRQFILWRHGHLGAGNRRVIPSCCVWKIRDQYPDSFGQYRGFVGGRLG